MYVFSGVRVTRTLVLCVCFVDQFLSFCPFFYLVSVLSVLRITDSDYAFGIFKLFLTKIYLLEVTNFGASQSTYLIFYFQQKHYTSMIEH